MPDSVGRLHFLFAKSRSKVFRGPLSGFFCLLFSIFKVGEHCNNSSNYPTLHKSAKSAGDLSAQIRAICGRPIIRIYAKIFSANCIFLIFFGYIFIMESFFSAFYLTGESSARRNQNHRQLYVRNRHAEREDMPTIHRTHAWNQH